jgi:hypothetical protein
MPQLDYALAQKWHQRRRTRRIAILLFALAAVALPTYFYGPKIYRRCQLLHRQNLCLNHAYPPNSVACNSDGSKGNYQPPSVLENFWNLAPGVSDYLSDPQTTAANLWDKQTYSVYVHRLDSPAGPRLVSVYINSNRGSYHSSAQLYANITVPATFTTDAQQVAQHDFLFLPYYPRIASINDYIIYSGQSDPANNSQFTIDIEIKKIRHTFRFELNNTGDHLQTVSITPPL